MTRKIAVFVSRRHKKVGWRDGAVKNGQCRDFLHLAKNRACRTCACDRYLLDVLLLCCFFLSLVCSIFLFPFVNLCKTARHDSNIVNWVEKSLNNQLTRHTGHTESYLQEYLVRHLKSEIKAN